MSRHALRPATLADVERVAALLREVAFKPRSEAGWRWLFQENPAVRRRDPPPEMGWVLDRDGAIDGYVGNVHLDYVLDGKPLRVATDNSYYVRSDARGESTRLMSTFFRQPGVDLFLNTTANHASSAVYLLFKALAPEDASLSEGLIWIADDRIAVRDALAKCGMGKPLGGGLAGLAAPLSTVARAIAGFAKPPRDRASGSVEKLLPSELDSRFDSLWERIAAAPGLKVRRDAATLRWYFSDPDVGGNPTIFATGDAEGLEGYAAVAQHCPPGTVTTQLRILDFVLRPGAEHAGLTLLTRVLVHAREVKAGLVYCPPIGSALSAELKLLRPYVLRHKRTSHLLRAVRSVKTADLVRPGVWQATALDGDTPFCIESVAPLA